MKELEGLMPSQGVYCGMFNRTFNRPNFGGDGYELRRFLDNPADRRDANKLKAFKIWKEIEDPDRWFPLLGLYRAEWNAFLGAIFLTDEGKRLWNDDITNGQGEMRKMLYMSQCEPHSDFAVQGKYTEYEL